MIKVTHAALIKCAQVLLFNTAADPMKQLLWDPETLKSVEKLNPGPLGKGAKYKGNFKGFGIMEYEFAEYEPYRIFEHTTTISFGAVRHRFEFESIAQGSQINQTITLDANFMGKLLSFMVRSMFKKRLKKISTELRAYLEK